MSLRHRGPDPHGILAVHASAVGSDEGALLFLGPSGAGKSTMVRLLAEETEVLAEDKVYLIPGADGAWRVADASERSLHGPLSEEEARALEGTPLGAMFRLHQAGTTRLARTDALATCRHLVDGFLQLNWHRYLDVAAMKMAYRSLARVSRRTAGYDLYFDESRRVVRTVLERDLRQYESRSGRPAFGAEQGR
jgi:energy-coupling factor transporter ATP-binding protein EcfA2